MRKLVLILLAFIAVVTFIRAFDNAGEIGRTGNAVTGEFSSEQG
jgi:hypothetical protein